MVVPHDEFKRNAEEEEEEEVLHDDFRVSVRDASEVRLLEGVSLKFAKVCVVEAWHTEYTLLMTYAC